MQKVNTERNKFEKSLCHACLSADRQLFSINPYLDIFYKFCENSKILTTPLLCWECTAVLRRIKKFQNAVKLSQEYLYIQHENNRKTLPNSLSHLEIFRTYTYIETIDSNELNNGLKEETQSNNEEKEVNDIKEESICYSDTEFNVENNDDYFERNDSQLDVKTEINDTVTIKKQKCMNKKGKRYQVLFGKYDKKEMEKLTIKVPIQLQEVKVLLDKDRDSDDYKCFKFKCERCVCGWHEEWKFYKHNERYHNLSANYECDICSKRFVAKRPLSTHLRSHRYVYECRACAHRGCSFSMKRHLATHSKCGLVQCMECKAKFTNLRLFYSHHREMHEIFICDYCGKICKSKNVIVKHISNNHGNFVCKSCNITFKGRKSYRKHYITKHTMSNGDDAYCVQCDKRFNNVYMYRSHLQYSSAHAHERKGDGPKKQVACPECGRSYSKKSYMMNHYKYVHMEKTNYHCDLCNKYFLNNTKYKDHIKYSHEGATRDKNKLCNICGRGFAANRTLINHIRTHSGERPFECEHCGAKFTQKYAMLSHVSHVHFKKKRRTCWQ